MTRSRQEPITSHCSRLIKDAIVYYACVILARAMLDCRCYWQHLNESDYLPRNKASTGGESIMRAVLVLCKIYPYIYLVRFASYLTRVLLFLSWLSGLKSIMIGSYIICLSKLHIRLSFETRRSTTYKAVSRLHFLRRPPWQLSKILGQANRSKIIQCNVSCLIIEGLRIAYCLISIQSKERLTMTTQRPRTSILTSKLRFETADMDLFRRQAI